MSLNRELLTLDLETDEAGEHDLSLVRKDVAAAGGADDISFVPGTPTSDWRYTAHVKPLED